MLLLRIPPPGEDVDCVVDALSEQLPHVRCLAPVVPTTLPLDEAAVRVLSENANRPPLRIDPL